ncbi:MAG: hypothetical protein CL983_06080 [Euryarchaeota archaeon]|nr:hypothetical protein [Euryarchaeota archaeon]
MKTEIDEIRNQKPPSIVISKPPSIIISEVNETTPEKEIKQLSQNVKENEPNEFNTKEYLIGLFTPGVVLILILMTFDYLDDKHNEWEEEYRDNYYYEFYDYDIPPEPINLDLEDELLILGIWLFTYILAIILAFGTKNNHLGLGLLTFPLLIFMLILFNL